MLTHYMCKLFIKQYTDVGVFCVCAVCCCVDQTPTPTRFLRNCEEVGLFSDLELSQASDEEVEESKQVGEMCKNGLKAMA